MGSNLASWFRVIVLGVAFSAGLPSVSLPAAPHTAIASVIPNGFGWQDEVVDQLGDVGYGASFALDPSGYALCWLHGTSALTSAKICWAALCPQHNIQAV